MGVFHEERDGFERALIRAALSRRKPVLGICRGIQILNAALGGTLFQDLETCRPGTIMHRQKAPGYSPVHEVETAPGALLSRILAEGNAAKIGVNSFHHQAVDRVAPGFVVSARAPDGLIEAIEPAPDRAWQGHPFTLGVQWHPERMVQRHAHAARLFAAFADACRGC
jgi:putative glutamine amidotransferase